MTRASPKNLRKKFEQLYGKEPTEAELKQFQANPEIQSSKIFLTLRENEKNR